MLTPQGYDSLRSACALLELPGEAVIELEGKDARRYLQRMLTNEVLTLEPGQGRRALALDVKGHVQADLSVLRTGEEKLLLTCEAAARAGAVKLLTFYALADELEVRDLTDESAVFSVQGPLAAEVASGLAPGPLVLGRELDHVSTSLGGVPARLCRHDRTGRGGWDAIVAAADRDRAREALERAARARGGGPASAEALDLTRLEAGRARFGPDFGTETIPQEAGLEQPAEAALSFEKGCFLGQEVVARLRFRGHVNKVLVGFTAEDDVPPGTPLRKGDKEVGRLTSVGRSPALGRVVALGYVRREHGQPGSELEATSPSGSVRVRVANRPFAP